MTKSTDVQHLYVFGAGGHGREVVWLAREVHPAAIIEHVVDDEHFAQHDIDGVPVRRLSEVAAAPGVYFVSAVGDSGLREAAAVRLTQLGIPPLTLVHPRAEIAPGAVIGEGTVVCAGVVLSVGVSIGDHAIINVGSTVSHDGRIDDFATLSPAVHLAGHVHVGTRALLGIGAVVINGSADHPLRIGADSLVAAGAAVIRDVGEGERVGGVPARALESGSGS